MKLIWSIRTQVLWLSIWKKTPSSRMEINFIHLYNTALELNSSKIIEFCVYD